ncbi:MAG: hypothetical protein ABR956_10665 [Terracidiphilus sp.]|jgi:hypothetical protein
MTAPTPTPFVDLTFPHSWQAEVLASRPLILPTRHFVYPGEAEEVERGALEVLIRPDASEQVAEKLADLKGHCSSPAAGAPISGPALAVEGVRATGHRFPQGLKPNTSSRSSDDAAEAVPFQSTDDDALPFLATCALGFRDPAVPTGLWSTPNPDEICAVAGGYAYIIRTNAPEVFTMIPYRPVLELRVNFAQGLLLFVGHHSILAWGADGQAWQSEKLSDEGVTINAIEDGVLHGMGWDLISDKETPFALELQSGLVLPELSR